ncbi:dienelactone hydrolase family protein [Cytophaga aurantiaca]|uniref:dienelactone hydrolase family protein n=1 Tax=Cytophaga aurantiaca TaxID=29530 RepID=UPI00037621D7|nr:dienelactone hydrolase family protein [Cytophaga aurantiaca]
MKKIILLIASIVIGATAFAQQPNCCKVAAASNSGMSVFSSDAAFRKAHKSPKAYTLVDAKGAMIQFDAADGKKANAYMIKASSSSNKYVFLIHEWWGLNDYIKKDADKLYADLGGKVNIMALDLYDGKVTSNRDSAAAYMGAANAARIISILNGAFTFAGTKAEIISMGWCFGGGWALQSSILAGDKSKGTVMYYGMTEKDPAKLTSLKGDVLGIFGTKDKWINPEMVETFKKDLTAAHKNYTFRIFDADHAFANPSNPQYNKAYTKEAWGMSVAFIKKAFLL